jgi:PIN domain nuclease of toxin-antitoxin system
VNEIVFDSSALVALIHGEPGADKVASHLGRAAISVVNLAETYGRLLRGAYHPDQLRQDISALELDLRVFDAEQAYAVGRLEPATRRLGLSLGDRACLALALALKLPALTGDRQWLKANVGVEIKLFR